MLMGWQFQLWASSQELEQMLEQTPRLLHFASMDLLIAVLGSKVRTALERPGPNVRGLELLLV